MAQDWRTLPETCIGFEKIPTSLSVKELWKDFSKFGTVVSITIDQDATGRSKGKGFVRFSPPPSSAFWLDPRLVQSSHKDNGMPAMKLTVKPYRMFNFPGLINTDHRYPHIVQIGLSHLDVGVLLNEDHMLSCFDTQPYPVSEPSKNRIYSYRPLTFSIHLEHREVQLNFPVHFSNGKIEKNEVNRTEALRFVISLQQQIKAFHCPSPRDAASKILIIAVESPPVCYRRGDEARSLVRNDFKWNENDSLYRQTDVVLDPRHRTVKKRPTSLRQDHSIINLSQWTCYAMEIDKDAPSGQYEQLFSCLQDHNIKFHNHPSFLLERANPTRVWDYIDPPILTDSNKPSSYSLSLLTSVIPLDFSVRYQLEVCISGGWFDEYNISEAFIERLRSMSPSKACALLEHVAADKVGQKSRRIQDPMSIFTISAPSVSIMSKIRPEYYAIVRSAVVTPTTLILGTPSCEISNRVIRHFSEHADRFLRVRFLDEKNRGRIYSSVGKDTMDEVFTRVFRTMCNGIVIGDRRYEFLAFGNSQFRENGAYFFSPTSTLNAAKIREWMGNFDHIKVVAKYAARLGQCFSTTRAMRSLKPIVKKIPDVERNGFLFTDGVGKISPYLAQVASQDFKIPMLGGVPPSVFQFRLAGSKGILTTWPNVKGLEVHIRDSQTKFQALKNDLEIIKWSQAPEFSLNRQIILVLSALGVPDAVFNDKLRHQLKKIDEAMVDEQVAQKVLCSSVDINGTTMVLANMVKDGFQAAKEPFMMTLLALWRAWSIKSLKEKAKIQIPKGAVLLGCTDETRTLKGHFEDKQHLLKWKSLKERMKALPEVFVQLSNHEGSGHSKVIEGLMIIARNPSLHAGDVRVVKGVNSSKLAHLKDCLVLPQTGDRDVASMCSGGDLDGDDFVVSWDPQLIPKEWNHEPMDFAPEPPYTKEGAVKTEDIIGFFVQYMKNADLGNIAYAHLATADAEPEGVKSDKCIRLAKIHSDAVDYPKSGRPANIPESLRPKKYPHFMERRRAGYISYNVLGQLYDSVKLVNFDPAYDNSFDKRILTAYECTKEMLESAGKLKEEYDNAFRRIMAQHGLKTEFEAWCAFALERNKNYGDFKFSEIIGEAVSALKAQYRGFCIEQAGGQNMSELGPFVAAMYTVTSQEMRAALDECESITWTVEGIKPRRVKLPSDMPLMSFPWLFPNVLGQIAKGRPIDSDGHVDEDNALVFTSGDVSPVRNEVYNLEKHFPRSDSSDASKTVNGDPVAINEYKDRDVPLEEDLIKLSFQETKEKDRISQLYESAAPSASPRVLPPPSHNTLKSDISNGISKDPSMNGETSRFSSDDEDILITLPPRPTAIDKLSALYGN